MKIFKWTLEITDKQVVSMPLGAKILGVKMQGDSPQMWALCDENAPKEQRHIAIYGTGNPIHGEPGKYITTFLVEFGIHVFHVFEIDLT